MPISRVRCETTNDITPDADDRQQQRVSAMGGWTLCDDQRLTGIPMTDAGYWLTTERLALRRFTDADFDWIASLYSDADVTRHLGGVKSRADARAFFDARILRYYEEHPGFGMWMTIQRCDAQPVGFHLLNHIRGESIVQVGFTIAKAAWNSGYATEMGEALLRYGFVDLELPRIAGMANRDNLASQRVLEKIGLERRGERAFSHPDYASAGPMAWFEREAGAWRAERERLGGEERRHRR
jgi:RimJ/RimL family protein N-acetyltransferase